MTDETPIPEDIMQAANRLLDHIQMSAGWHRVEQLEIIARALMAERAKCEAELATLRAENERLREALRPFATRACIYDPECKADDDTPDWFSSPPLLLIRDFRRARAALKGGE